MKRSTTSLFLTTAFAIAASVATLTGCSKSATSPSAIATATAPSQAAPAAAPTQSSAPADDPADIAKMMALAKLAATTNPDDQNATTDGIIDGPFNPSGQNLQAGKPRADGYPNYAVTCDFKKDSCSFLNGEGSQLQDSVEHLYSNTITVVRNADVLSGKYTCRHGFCIDGQGNLVGRVSAAVAQAKPAVMQ